MDCSACQTKSVCPDIINADGTKRVAKACTNDCLVPTSEEMNSTSPFGQSWESGKVFSCRCGGDDRTDPYCQFQKDTTFLFHVTGEGKGVTQGVTEDKNLVKMHVKEYAGIPNMAPDSQSDPWRYDYAYAPVWDANFTGCAWRVSSCLDPLPTDETCAIYECPNGKVQCPPEDVPKCPGRSELGCSHGPNSTRNYWQHPCNPLVTPQDQGITFWCSLNRTSTDAYGTNKTGRLCYWNQPGVIPSFAVTCDVGNCLYDDSKNAELKDLCPASFTPPEFWNGDLITRVGMFLVALVLVAAAGWYIRVERNSLYSMPAATAFEEVEAARMNPNQNRQRNKHARTPSAVRDAQQLRRRPMSPERDAGVNAITSLLGEADSTSNSTPLDPRPVVSWSNVRVYATSVTSSNPGGVVKRILRGVSGHAGPGPSVDSEDHSDSSPPTTGVFAILGPSGAGKSTLLDFLAGRTPVGQAARGTIKVNGTTVTPSEMKQISGYVPQTDILPGTSTVWEHLLFNTMLRMPSGTSKEELTRSAVSWSKELGLQKVINSLIGDEWTRGLSGGEKRRVSIATSLLTSPSILFLDEPTTGLDSTNAQKVVDLLSALGSMGVTVLLSIHQPRPDIFRLLDRVLLMSGTGSVVYCGPMMSLQTHFDTVIGRNVRITNQGITGHGAVSQGQNSWIPTGVDVADFVLDFVLKSEDSIVDGMVYEFKNSDVHRKDTEFLLRLDTHTAHTDHDNESFSRNKRPIACFSKQLKLLCGRLLRKVSRHPFLLGVHFASTFFTAIGVGLIFYDVQSDQAGIQNRLGALFFVLLYLTCMSLSSLPVWREDRLLFLREKQDGVYGVNAYFVSAMLFDILPMRVLPPFFFGLTTYSMIGLNEGTEYSLITFVNTLIVTNICATCMCMAIGSVTKSVASANAIASLCFLVSFLFGGFLLNKDQIPSGPIRWLSKLSFINYGYESLVNNEFGKNPTTFTLTSAWHSKNLPDEVPVPGEKVLSTFGFDSTRTVYDLFIVFLQAVFFASLSYLMLRNAEGGPLRSLMDLVGRRAVVRDGGDTSRGVRNSTRRRSLDQVVSSEDGEGVGTPLIGRDEDNDSGSDDDDTSEFLSNVDVDEEAALPGPRNRRSPPSTLQNIDEEQSVRGEGNALNALLNYSEEEQDAGVDHRRMHDMQTTHNRQTVRNNVSRSVLVWSDVKCSLKSGRKILRGVSGIAGSGGFEVGMSNQSGLNRNQSEGSSLRMGIQSEQSSHSSGIFAILGPSGAGKSTLLDILAGRPSANRVVSGSIRVNGVEFKPSEMRHVSGYVPQDDVLPGTSTVYEHLLFHATLRMPSHTSESSIKSSVVRVMKSLGIEKLKNQFIGDEWVRGLSGGEKRRVTIATELITSPNILFLDEPTTGLDSTNAMKVVDLLSDLSDDGVTVILSIHQPRPDVFRLLRRILVMSSVGKAVYSGDSRNAETHFLTLLYVPMRQENVNVADYVLDVLLRASDETVERMVSDFETSHAAVVDANARRRLITGNTEGTVLRNARNGQNVTLQKKKFNSGYGTQFAVLLKRMTQKVKRHPFLIALHFVSTFCVALGVGFIFKSATRNTGGIQNRMGALFFVLLHLALMSLSSLPVWREERLLFLRERLSGLYSTWVYFSSVLWFDVVILRVLPPLFFTMISYPMIGLHGFGDGEGSVQESEGEPSGDESTINTAISCLMTFTILLVLTNVAASGLMMTIGMITPSNATANACGLLVLLVNLLCGGFFLNEQKTQGDGESVPISVTITKVLSSGSFVNRAFEALLINEFLDAGVFQFTPKWKNSENSNHENSIAVDVTGQEVLQFFKFGDTTRDMWNDIAALTGLAVGYVTLAFIALKWTTRKVGVE